MPHTLLDVCAEKVLVFDGAMGTSLQAQDLGPDDFEGLEGCNEILVATRPQAVREVHAGFLQAGVDVVETNSFGSNEVVLAEYGIAERAYELSRRAAQLAAEVARDYSTVAQPRFVCGSVGPGTKLPSLGHIDFEGLRAAFLPQFLGLVDGGADALIIETCQDPLQVKAALDAARLAFRQLGRRLPLLISVTVESSGTMLLGSDLSAALSALLPYRPDSFGLNCATGPETMKRFVQQLAALGPARISAMPNAGLPRSEGGRIVYPMGPEEFADWVEGFVRDEGVGIVGGCCGTTAAHLEAVVRRVGGRAAPARVAPLRQAEVASLFQSVGLRQEPPPLMVGERLNSNGSREFRTHLLGEDLEGMLDVAREQERQGAHVLDVSVAYVGRDEAADLARLVPELARQSRLPLMIDSTEPPALEAALQRHGGRCIVNSINLESGPARPAEVLELARRYGAAVVALVIDEQGMAMTRERKLAVAERLYELAVGEHGLAPEDLIFDMLTFTVGSGDPSLRASAAETLAAIAELKRRHPEVQTVLGVSNVSFGLAPALRRALNSVFLAQAVRQGLDLAIVNVKQIVPLHRLDGELQALCLRLLRGDDPGDPLAELLARFGDVQIGGRDGGDRVALEPAEELQRHVLEGNKRGLPELLATLMGAGRSPLSIINELLIPAMKEVGVLFGAGQMQLPFVLQAAEVMKASVAELERHMDSLEGSQRGTFVIGTVRGDVHDIGKNLVDIILSNNGYRVVNLGIKVPIEQMIQAVDEHQADALGMSGLLVKSTVIMRENLEELRRRGRDIPVLLGGAALTRRYVEEDLRAVYGPRVHYGEDAFEGLRILDELRAGGAAPEAEAPASAGAAGPGPRIWAEAPALPADYPAPEVDRSVAVPTPPFWGARQLSELPLAEILPLMNETALVRGRWRYRRGQLERAAYEELVEREVQPVLRRLHAEALEGSLVAARAAYGYFRCQAEGEQVVLERPEGGELTRLTFPRRPLPPHLCIADYFRPAAAGPDLIGLFVVTLGAGIGARIQELFAQNAYRDYLHLHGFSVELADAAAEWLHARMRRELGCDDGAALSPQALVRQAYRGSRYSFGYPACPDLAQQVPLFEALQAERIGVQLSETFQMVPEQSVSAVVVHHPQAKYFSLD